MTTGPSQEYVKGQLESADEALSDAKYLLAGDRLKAAANRAYYAMFHAVQAALEFAQLDRPRSHTGAITLFSRRYVRSGRLDRRLARSLQDAYDLRRRSDYDVYAAVGRPEVSDVVQQAEAFLTEVRRLLEQANGE
ncbi:MAG: HEPN domain-containing protein [Chloroflexi bacterium]|nr:HEPN domain-containing protein [Chloroflexota bacterium]